MPLTDEIRLDIAQQAIAMLQAENTRLRNALEISVQAAQSKHGEYEALRAVTVALETERDALRAQLAAAQAALADEQTRTEHLIRHTADEIVRKDKLLTECAKERAEYAGQYIAAPQAGQWQPAEDGELRDGDGYVIEIEEDGSTIRPYVTSGFSVILPPDLRLCRRTTPTP